MNLFGGLRSKIIGLIVLVVVVFMTASFLALVFMHRSRTLHQFEFLTAKMGELIGVGLENGMIERKSNIAQEMIDQLAGHGDIEQFFIVDKHGEVKISSDPALVGMRFELDHETCQICHRLEPESRSRSVIFERDGQRVFRSVTPLVNEIRCHGCHAPAEKLNGVLISDFSMEPFDRELRAGFLGTIVTIGTIILGLTVVISIVIDQNILRRLSRFLESVRSISSGNLAQRIPTEGNDEISQLERAFNTMAANLDASLTDVRMARDSLGNLINSIEDEIVVINRDYAIVGVNSAAISRLGKSRNEVIGRSCHVVCYGSPEPCSEFERDCPVRKTFSSGASCSTSRSLVANGETCYFEQYVSPVRNETGEIVEVVKISRDVTRRKKLEEQLFQSERLISLGQLAAGMAHQVNNPIGIIVNRIDCLKREIASGRVPDSFENDLEVMLGCAWRVSETVRSLLTFSREAPMVFEPFDVNTVINTALRLVRLQPINDGITFRTDLQRNLPTVKGDSSKLEQCLVNILNNAIDAVETEGSISVMSLLDPEDGDSVCIKISDTGMGINAENLGKVFNPFFTTKPVGKGTGLGLSISYGIVQDHGGRIEVTSLPGEGTTFTIILPAGGKQKQ